MKKSVRSAILATALALLLGGMQSQASAALVIDNFEGYTAGQVIANGAASTPWNRSGTAINDQLYATNNASRLISGNISGQITLYWSNGTSANVRRNYAADPGQDFRNYATAQIDVRSMNATSATVVKLSIESNVLASDGTRETFGTATALAQPLAGNSAIQTLTFNLNSNDLVYTGTGTPGTLEAALANVRSIGVRFEVPAKGTNETVVLDNFILNAPIPEPTSLGLIGLGGLALCRRSRAKAI
jgi:hypothetical protein